jgi:hypothetical protein
MKKRLFLLSVLLMQQAGAERWALRNSASGKYLFAQNESAVAADEFSLKDSAFSWCFEKQPDGTVFIRNVKDGNYLVSGGKIETAPEAWTVAQTHEYQWRTFKAKSGRVLELDGFGEWKVEPVPEPVDLKGRGAKIIWTEYQAEEGETTGRTAGPSTDLADLACEAVGRMAVFLEKEGDSLAWTVKEAADGFSIRYSIPDAPAGGGINASLSLYINGKKTETLPLTSKYAWLYGAKHRGAHAHLWTNDPENGDTRIKFYDTARFVLKTPVKAGDRLELRKDADDTAAFYLIDLIELEKIPPAGNKPDQYLCITDFGAVANDGKDDSAALKEALAEAARGKTPGVWVPAGVFDFESPVPLPVKTQMDYQRFALNDVHLQGAGIWHTELRGQGLAFWCGGNHIRVSDMTFDWQGTSRASAILFDGKVGERSEFWNLYFTHCSVAFSVHDATSRDFKIRDSRIRSTFAGGINLRGGHQNAVMENIHVRGTGDDGLIFWSPGDGSKPPTRDSVIRNCTVEAPWMANCFIMAGGEGCRLENCVGRDGVRHCGIRVTTQIYITPTQPFTGKTYICNVSLIRCGSEKSDSYYGALQLEAHGHDVTGIEVDNCDIYSAPYSSLQIYTKIDSKSKGGKKVDAKFANMNIHGAALYGVHVMDRTPGKIELINSSFDGILLNDILSESKEMELVNRSHSE